MRSMLEFLVLPRPRRTHVTKIIEIKVTQTKRMHTKLSLLLSFTAVCLNYFEILAQSAWTASAGTFQWVQLVFLIVYPRMAYMRRIWKMWKIWIEHCASHTDRILIRNAGICSIYILKSTGSYDQPFLLRKHFPYWYLWFANMYLLHSSSLDWRDATIFNLFFIPCWHWISPAPQKR